MDSIHFTEPKIVKEGFGSVNGFLCDTIKTRTFRGTSFSQMNPPLLVREYSTSTTCTSTHMKIHTRNRDFQHRWKNYVCCGTRDIQVVGPHYMECNLNAATYLHSLQDELPRLLQNAGVPAGEMENIMFQHDGCPAHQVREVTAYLDEAYPDNWIGNNNNEILMRWPPRTPDSTPLDFLFWGHIKENFHLTALQGESVVRPRIQEAINEINDAILQAMQSNLVRRAQACIDVEGGHFEQINVYGHV